MGAALTSGREAYLAAARPLIEHAAGLGLHVQRLGELRRHGPRCEPLLTELLEALRDTSSRELLEELASVLAAPWARGAAFGPLAGRFRECPNSPPTTKAALAQALGLIADESAAAELVALSLERKHGNARAALVTALGRLDAQSAWDALLDLLADPGVGGHALAALAESAARRRVTLDEARVRPFLRDGRPWVRRAAKDLLHVIAELG